MTKTGPQKYSYQGYRCSNEHRFASEHSSSPFTNSFIEYAVILYLRSLSFNSTVSILNIYFEEEVITKKSLMELFERVSDILPTLREIDFLFYPKRSGYLAFDGVYFKLNGKPFVVLVCFDPETLDIVCYQRAEKESEGAYLPLAQEAKELLEKQGMAPTGIYSDGDRGLVTVLKRVFPNTPYQLCIVHKYLKMGDLVPFKSIHRKSVPPLKKRKTIKFKQMFEDVIFAKTKEDSLDNFKYLEQFVKRNSIESFYRGYRSLRINFSLTLTHYDHPHMQRDNNIIEGFNSLISRRLDLLKGFKKEDNIEKYLKLVLLDYRFHKLTESGFAYRRDKSPLELARASIPKHYNFIKMLRQSLSLTFEL
ncbi:MAG: transposase [bacterium]